MNAREPRAGPRRMPLRYAGWMARDVAAGPGLPMLAVAALALLLMNSVTITTDIAGGQATVLLYELDLATKVLILLATAGMVSADFAGGYHRTLFAHPVSPPLYYLERWIVGGVAVLVCAAPMALAVAIRLDGSIAAAGGLLVRASLMYFLLGGLVFLLSTFLRRDWLVAVLLLLLQATLGFAETTGFASHPLTETVYALLPPFHLVGVQRPLPTGGALLYVALYGVALAAAALAVLRWRPLSTGARG
ncbi:MAG TPA: hypothetical protein VFW66_09290 [Gemmatimonadales bacterium]|nr:hypothetical protein [Gemmatimonadales bacterium]